MRKSFTPLKISTIDLEVPPTKAPARRSDGILQIQDIIPISIFTSLCIVGAILISTYEDYDVTHTRPNPSTLRRSSTNSNSLVNFWGASTKGMGWGSSDREDTFEDWYGSSAATLQWKSSYNEIMLQHRSERVPRWERTSSIANKNNAATLATKEELQQAVNQLYKSLDELDELKLMADDYNWDGIKEYLGPKSERILPTALEYSMDVLKTLPSYYAQQQHINSNSVEYASGGATAGKYTTIPTMASEAPEIIGFDWGSCAWRHCGAKADAQEATAELYSSVGMLEPFECRFIIDIAERSIRDVLAIIPDDIKPTNQKGVIIQPKTYVEYISKGGGDSEVLGIDEEYMQALSVIKAESRLSVEE